MTTIDKLLSKAAEGGRLTPEEGTQLFECHDLVALGRAADAITRRLHPEKIRTYNIDRNINYTNVCAAVCDFCAFYRKSTDEDAYILPREELYKKIEETIELGGDQILLQGGNHPSLKIEWYEEMLRDLRSRYPQINLHAFSASEIWHIHKISKISLVECLQRLKAAALAACLAAARRFSSIVRSALTVNKVMTEEWLEVHRQWHKLGGRSTCTMMFGHVETYAERVEHLDRLRQLQDETGGFTAFICWTFQPGHKMADHPAAGSHEYLRTQAIARLYLDNIPNIQSSWVTQGGKIGQLALFFGANDMGSLMIEENVVAAAGTVHHLALDEIQRLIRDAGFEPRQRNVFYQLIETVSESKPKKTAANGRSLNVIS